MQMPAGRRKRINPRSRLPTSKSQQSYRFCSGLLFHRATKKRKKPPRGCRGGFQAL
jgi:hypothetical protein